MKTLLITAFTIISLHTFSQTEIKAVDASKHVGDSVKVCSIVAGGKYLVTSTDKLTLLDFGGRYPGNPLTIVIHDDVRRQLGIAPEQAYKGRTICVKGKIELYKGKPELIIKNKSQIVSVK